MDAKLWPKEATVIRKAKILSMLWKTPGVKTDDILTAVNEVYDATCELYGVDPKIGFKMETT